MSSDQDFMSKLPKLTGAKNFIPWRRQMKAYIQRNDIELLGLTDLEENSTSAHRTRWNKAMVQAKTSIILSLGTGPMAQTSEIIDNEDASAKDLWDAISNLYTTSNEQAVINLMQELEILEYKNDGSWETHLNKFHEILGKLASLGKPIPDDQKISKLIRTLPDHFAPLAMISSHMSFDDLVNAVETEISRRKMRKSEGSSSNVNIPKVNTAISRDKERVKDGRIDKKKNGNFDGCYICGRHNHRSRDCWYRADKLAEQGLPPYRGSGRGRGRGIFRGRGSFRGGRGRGFHRSSRPYPNHYELSNQHQHWFQAPSNPNQANSSINASGQAQVARVPNSYQHYPDNPSNLYPSNPPPKDPFGFMAQIKFRSTVAKCSENKTSDALIDSGGSHHFFHSKLSFVEYYTIDNVDVQAAAEMSTIVGKGKVFIPLQGGLWIEAYHAPHFQANILSVGLLTQRFNTLFTMDPPARDFVSTCIISHRKTNEVVKMIEIGDDGLYRLPLRSKKPSQCLQATAEGQLDSACIICPKTFASTAKTEQDNAIEWHNRTGHPHADRYIILSNVADDVPHFNHQTLNNILCIPCQLGKARRGKILPSTRATTTPLQLVHLDITGKISTPSLGGCQYAVGFVDDRTAKTDVHFIAKKSDLFMSLKYYKERSENVTGNRLINIRLDGAGENLGSVVKEFCMNNGIRLEPSPPYAPESNGVAERFMQELGTRARVLLFAAKLHPSLWAEAMNHGNWLRNRLPSRRIDNRIPILKWDPEAKLHFKNLPIFGQHGFAFVYQSNTRPNRKFSARSIHGQFVGMESDSTLYRVYVPSTNRVLITRRQDFRICADEKLPSVSALLDGISRQSELEPDSTSSEEALSQAFQAFRIPLSQTQLNAYKSKQKFADPRLPKSFREAVRDPRWCEAIDREYLALRNRGTWEYVPAVKAPKPLPFTWVFRLKPLDSDGKDFLHKARCCVRGDMQFPGLDFDPNTLYAPVASHEAIRMLLAIAAADDLIVEGGDVCNAYLYGDIDVDIYIDQPTDSSGISERPGCVCKLKKSMYGLKQAGEIWGSVLATSLINWNFCQSKIDSRVFFKKIETQFVIVVIVVDDMKFVSNSSKLLGSLKTKLGESFDVKFFGKLSSFIGWEVEQGSGYIRISQSRYTEEILTKNGLHRANGAWTPLPSDLSVNEQCESLSKSEHTAYRAIVGELLYLAVCTRPDLSFAVGFLSRQVHAPNRHHMILLKRVLRYLSGTRNLGIRYNRQESGIQVHSLEAFCDADWAGDKKSRKSTSGFVICLHGAPISWKSRRQSIIALSSAEAEYISLSACAKNVLWMRRLHWELQHATPFIDHVYIAPTRLYTDNTAAISLALNDQISAKSKHIEVRFHHLRFHIKSGDLSILYVRSVDQIADLLTKSVTLEVQNRLRPKLLR